METTHKDRKDYPILSLLIGHQLTRAQKLGVLTAILFTGAAIGVFIWLIVEAAAIGSARGIVLMSSFILFAVGILYYLLARVNNRKKAWNMLYLTIPLAVAAFVVSLYLDNGSTAPTRDMQQAYQIEQTYGGTGEGYTVNLK